MIQIYVGSIKPESWALLINFYLKILLPVTKYGVWLLMIRIYDKSFPIVINVYLLFENYITVTMGLEYFACHINGSNRECEDPMIRIYEGFIKPESCTLLINFYLLFENFSSRHYSLWDLTVSHVTQLTEMIADARIQWSESMKDLITPNHALY